MSGKWVAIEKATSVHPGLPRLAAEFARICYQ
jgi:hypothetical protein